MNVINLTKNYIFVNKQVLCLIICYDGSNEPLTRFVEIAWSIKTYKNPFLLCLEKDEFRYCKIYITNRLYPSEKAVPLAFILTSEFLLTDN